MNELDYQTLVRARAIYDEIASEDKALSEAFLLLMMDSVPAYDLVQEPPPFVLTSMPANQRRT